jgi:predicted XRE-type DNA-binding protein
VQVKAKITMEVEIGSENVFADLGLTNPEERLAKAELASRIGAALRQLDLTQAAAAELLGIDQPKVSRLLRGYLMIFSVERLMHFLTLLGQDVEIVLKPAPRSRPRGQVRVVAAA